MKAERAKPSSARSSAKGERPPQIAAWIVHVEFKRRQAANKRTIGSDARTPHEKLEETLGLAEAIGLNVMGSTIATLEKIEPRSLLGKGKIEKLRNAIEETQTTIVIINASLSPVQQRNLEREWNVKVIDRTGLILEIFGERAHTREGRLQVELAHLQYQKSRLVRSWTHLERQRGGFGFLGGPGESQLEIDRRLIGERISRIEREIESVKRTRGLHRKSRTKIPYPAVALVGYTNAGKSTLFNRLTKSAVLAKNILFATLDPTMREVVLPHGRRIILSDTVGFISQLPTTLIAAFRATLEEVLAAELILHVRDISHTNSAAQASDVESVLDELGVDEVRRHDILEVWNKADLIDNGEQRMALANQAMRRDNVVIVSALTGEGLPQLLELIETKLAASSQVYEIELAATDGKDLSWLYTNSEVLRRLNQKQGSVVLEVRFDPEVFPIALGRFGPRLRRFDERQGRMAAE